MEETRAVDSKRSLAAILITDAEGFSALASRDEARALSQLQSDMDAMRECCTRFNGRVIKSTGDGFLMRFDSAVEAVQCGMDIQAAMAVRTGEGLFRHRIGVHLGDVLLTQDDAYGDGVNVASRLQAGAAAGTVWISQTVFDTIRGKVACRSTFEGEKHFKGLAAKIPVWSVAPGEGVVGGPKRHTPPWAMLAAPAILVLAIGLAVYSTNMRNDAAKDAMKASQDRQKISELLQSVDGGGAMSNYEFERLKSAIATKQGAQSPHPNEVAMLEGLETWRNWLQTGLDKATEKAPVKAVVSTPKGQVPVKAWSDKKGVVTVSDGKQTHDFKFEDFDPETLVAFTNSLAATEPQDRRIMIARNLKNFQQLYAHPKFPKVPLSKRITIRGEGLDQGDLDQQMKAIHESMKREFGDSAPIPGEGTPPTSGTPDVTVKGVGEGG
ncbi:MAG: adenylate/guanylate cyclase domain-containing protein [Armatimonadetes bacterium]|nr:adenylate/guanylate cyclase domain-containing protein [Armatimonadota bacterium]